MPEKYFRAALPASFKFEMKLSRKEKQHYAELKKAPDMIKRTEKEEIKSKQKYKAKGDHHKKEETNQISGMAVRPETPLMSGIDD